MLITCSHTLLGGAPGQGTHAPRIWGAGPPSPSKPSLLVLHFNQWLFSSLNLLHMKEFTVQSTVMEEGSILAWAIPWTEEPGGKSPWGSTESDMTE